ncbi:MAG: glycosyltransferase family 4 protein, partial [Deltaproteobacteria bacterium]|nr:glycosyltransferase family 4 protein [Deltaproteobacteria bacterium]
EAMAEAKPVIASRIPGLDEVVVDGRTGLLVEPGDADGFAEAMITLMEYPERAEALGAQGRKRVAERFSIDRTVKATVALYEELLNER